MSAATTVAIEVVLLSAVEGQLRFRVRRAGQGQSVPDEIARALAGLRAEDAAGLLHSTSWRFDGSRIVLTYAALPDPDETAATAALGLAPIVTGLDPLAPSPPRIGPHDVAVHACRHLAFLRGTDPLVAATAAHAAGLWTLIDRFTPTVAGRLAPPSIGGSLAAAHASAAA